MTSAVEARKRMPKKSTNPSTTADSWKPTSTPPLTAIFPRSIHNVAPLKIIPANARPAFRYFSFSSIQKSISMIPKPKRTSSISGRMTAPSPCR